jgi:hypothetical protein
LLRRPIASSDTAIPAKREEKKEQRKRKAEINHRLRHHASTELAKSLAIRDAGIMLNARTYATNTAPAAAINADADATADELCAATKRANKLAYDTATMAEKTKQLNADVLVENKYQRDKTEINMLTKGEQNWINTTATTLPSPEHCGLPPGPPRKIRRASVDHGSLASLFDDVPASATSSSSSSSSSSIRAPPPVALVSLPAASRSEGKWEANTDTDAAAMSTEADVLTGIPSGALEAGSPMSPSTERGLVNGIAAVRT